MAKETSNKTNKTPTDWEKIIAKGGTDKGLISKTIKQFMELSIRKTNNPNRQEACTDIPPKKAYKWPAGVGNDAL